MHVIQPGRQRKGEVRAHEGILGIASIYRIAGEGRVIAEILHSMTAVPALAIHAAHPGNTDSRSQRQLRCLAVNHLSDDLMAWDELRSNRRQVSFHDV
jgi:hypothetical protein